MTQGQIVGLSDWSGRAVLVTGATQGLGREAALAWHGAGARVIVHGRTQVDGPAEEARRATERWLSFQADAATVGELGDSLARMLDVEEVDAVLLNHGATVREGDGVRLAPPLSYSSRELADLMQVNALSMWECLQAVAGAWDSAAANVTRRRSVVLISSSGVGNTRAFDPYPYRLSKAVVNRLAHDLAHTFAEAGIALNVVSPGMIDGGLSHLPGVRRLTDTITAGIPMARYGTVGELVSVLDLFLSGRVHFATGNNLLINGGTVST